MISAVFAYVNPFRDCSYAQVTYIYMYIHTYIARVNILNIIFYTKGFGKFWNYAVSTAFSMLS